MTTITDQTLKSYFLGSLAVADAERLEEELATEAELFEQAQMVETELADDYLRRNLSAAERRSFEKNYLTTAARREKFRTTENLWQIAAENQKKFATPAPSFWQTLFGHRALLAFGSLAAIGLIGGFVFVWLNSSKNTEISRQANINHPPTLNNLSQGDNPSQENNSVNLTSNVGANSENQNAPKSANGTALKPTAAPEIKAPPKPSAPPVPTTPNLATFVLTPSTLRSEGEQFIKIKPATNKINLRLTLPKDAVKYQRYRAVLRTADGATIATLPNLKSPNIFLTAPKLENQTYLVLLEGYNSPGKPAESVAEYTFRVRR